MECLPVGNGPASSALRPASSVVAIRPRACGTPADALALARASIPLLASIATSRRPSLWPAKGPVPAAGFPKVLHRSTHAGVESRSVRSKGPKGLVVKRVSSRCLAPPFCLGVQGFLDRAWMHLDLKTPAH